MEKREIKFRAWIGDPKGMIYSDSYISLEYFFNACENGILMQYTVLKDKNGKEIYDGDIVEDDCTTFKIEWYKGRFDFVIIKGAIQYPYFGDNCSRMQIIGNVFENPDLLK